MADSDSTPRRRLPRGADKLPPDFHAVDTRPEGARETDEYEATHSAASKLFDLRYLIGGLFTVYGIMLTVAGSSPQMPTRQSSRHQHQPLAGSVHVAHRHLLPGLGEAQSTEAARAEPDRYRPANDASLTYRVRGSAAATPRAAAAVPAITMPNPLKAAAT